MKRYVFMFLALVLFTFGLFVIFRSVGWGNQAANAYLISQGGDMDTTQFVIFLQEYIHTYQWIGSILSLIGGLGVMKEFDVR